MRSQRHSETSRINGAKSHGPKTPQGRAISSMNAIDHGITAKTLILRKESDDLFMHMMKSYFDFFKPANQVEIDIACDIVAARWRLHRIWRYQTAMLDLEMDTQAPAFEKRFETFDQDMRGAAAFSAIVDNSKGFVTALKTDIHLTRRYRRAVDDLRCPRSGNLLNKEQVFPNRTRDQGPKSFEYNKIKPKISTEPKELKTI